MNRLKQRTIHCNKQSQLLFGLIFNNIILKHIIHYYNLGQNLIYKLERIGNAFSIFYKSVSSISHKMAANNAKTLLVRTFIIEHNGSLLRYTEKIEEVAKVDPCNVIDLTIDNDDNETDNSASSRPTIHQKREISFACFDDDLQPYLKKQKVNGDDQPSSNASEDEPASPIYEPASPVYESPTCEPGSPPYFRPTTPAYANPM